MSDVGTINQLRNTGMDHVRFETIRNSVTSLLYDGRFDETAALAVAKTWTGPRADAPGTDVHTLQQ